MICRANGKPDMMTYRETHKSVHASFVSTATKGALLVLKVENVRTRASQCVINVLPIILAVTAR